jgi:hypothetical protein
VTLSAAAALSAAALLAAAAALKAAAAASAAATREAAAAASARRWLGQVPLLRRLWRTLKSQKVWTGAAAPGTGTRSFLRSGEGWQVRAGPGGPGNRIGWSCHDGSGTFHR